MDDMFDVMKQCDVVFTATGSEVETLIVLCQHCLFDRVKLIPFSCTVIV